jgi:SpoVK/Ycf46/Vps4 family AAA+-type ATPase
MDGFGTDRNVIVLGATNRKDILDPALTRLLIILITYIFLIFVYK